LEAGEIFCALTLFTSVKQDLDRRCEQLLATKFNEKCDFEVDDAISKLEKLEIVSKVRTPQLFLSLLLLLLLRIFKPEFFAQICHCFSISSAVKSSNENCPQIDKVFGSPSEKMQDSEGMYTDESLTHANDIIGVTTDELVEKTFVKSK
jgi:hypothetical protein